MTDAREFDELGLGAASRHFLRDLARHNKLPSRRPP